MNMNGLFLFFSCPLLAWVNNATAQSWGNQLCDCIDESC